MRVESVSVDAFRSINNTHLVDCQGFNALVGKNNAGKSNILAAIDGFFRTLELDRVVFIDPPIGEETDFYGGTANRDISITVRFELDQENRQAIIGDIASEAPQLQNALEALDANLRLAVTLRVHRGLPRFAYVSRVYLTDRLLEGFQTGGTDVMLLDVPELTAVELARARFESAQLLQDSQTIRVTAPDLLRSWESNREAGGLRRTSSLGMTRRISLRPLREVQSPDVAQAVLGILEEMSSPDDVVREIQRLSSQLEEDALAIQQRALSSPVATYAGEQLTIPQYATNIVNRLSSFKVLYLKERRNPIGKEEAIRLLDLRNRREGDEPYVRIQQTVRELLGVEIRAFSEGSITEGSEVVAGLDVDQFLVQANGAGIREALRLVLDFEFERPDVLLVEEPEIHLHPALEIALMKRLQEIGRLCQVFLTTHSTNFLDGTEASNVYLVSKKVSTSARLLDTDGVESFVPGELGLRLSSLFLFDRLVFVEGVSDEAVLRTFAARIGINLSQANVGFVAMGGVRNFASYATEATLSFLKKRNVSMIFVVDRDEMNDADVTRLQSVLGDRARMEVLQKREIENYLVVPEGIVEFIKEKRLLSGQVIDDQEPSVDEIREAIERRADVLKEVVIGRRVKRRMNNTYHTCSDLQVDMGTVEEVIPEIRRRLEDIQGKAERSINELEGAWETERDLVEGEWVARKLDIVPGDVLLDSVCSEYGVRFKKSTDSERLTRCIPEAQIPLEIKNLLGKIGG